MDVSLGFGLGDVTGALATMWNVQQQKKVNEQNLEYGREQATTAFERQKELMNLQNKYNDPASQMQRYVDAGLNPNLVYGTPNLSAGASPVSTGSPGNAQAPQVDPLLASQIANIQADTESKKAQAGKTDAETDNIKQMTPLEVDNAAAQLGYTKEQTKLVTMQIDVQRQTSLLLQEQNLGQHLDNLFKKSTYNDMAREIAARADTAQAEADYAAARFVKELALMDAQIGDYNSHSILNRANARLAEAQKGVAESTKQQIDGCMHWTIMQARENAYLTKHEGLTQLEFYRQAAFNTKHQAADRVWRLTHETVNTVSGFGKAAGGLLGGIGKMFFK